MVQFKVEGMSCGGCANAIKNALAAIDSEIKVTVDLKSQTVQVESKEDEKKLASAIEEAGYPVLHSERTGL